MLYHARREQRQNVDVTNVRNECTPWTRTDEALTRCLMMYARLFAFLSFLSQLVVSCIEDADRRADRSSVRMHRFMYLARRNLDNHQVLSVCLSVHVHSSDLFIANTSNITLHFVERQFSSRRSKRVVGSSSKNSSPFS